MNRGLPPDEQFNLMLQTVLDYEPHRGAGIGIVQQIECVSTGAIMNDRFPSQERKHSYSRKQLVTNNIKTTFRAHILALIHAIGMARRAARDNPLLRNATIFSDSTLVVETINYHVQNPDALQNVASTNDRSIIKSIVAKLRKLSSHDLQVTVAVTRGKDEARKSTKGAREQDKAYKRSTKMARQGGRAAWRGCRRRQRAEEYSTQSGQDNEAQRP